MPAVSGVSISGGSTMLRIRVFTALLATPALAFLVLTSGCSKEDKNKDGSNENKEGTSTQQTKLPKTEVPSTGTGTLTGVVLVEGTPPPPEDYSAREDWKKNSDKDECNKGDTKSFTWRVGPGGGLGNVVVWVAPPASNQYFKVPAADKRNWPEEVAIDQPHCAFEPHVLVLYPSHFDLKANKQVPTGQKFKIKNSAPMAHNTNYGGGPDNPSINHKLAPKEEKEVLIRKDTKPIEFKCNIHPWMNAHAWAFDHPYAAVTDEKGNFTIKDAPAGADVNIMYWHESFGNSPKKLETAPKQIKANEDNKVEIKVPAK